MICANCEREFVGTFCPYCDINNEKTETVEREQEMAGEEKQSGFGIASFVLAIVGVSFCFTKKAMVGDWLALVVISYLQLLQNLVTVIAFVFGTIGMCTKNRKTGFAIAGNIISFILFWL